MRLFSARHLSMALLLGAIATSSALAQNYKLSPPLTAEEDVIRIKGVSPAISDDGNWVAFQVSKNGNEELYTVAIDGSGPAVQLSADRDACFVTGDDCEVDGDCPEVGTCAIGTAVCETNADCPGLGNSCVGIQPQSCLSLRGVKDFAFTPDGAFVVFRGDQDTSGVNELYARAVDGTGSTIKLNGAIVSGGAVDAFTISPDSSQVVYRADQSTVDVFELFSVPLNGSSPAVSLSGGVSVQAGPFAVTEAGGVNYAVFSCDLDANLVFELNSAEIGSGDPPVVLNPALAGNDLVFVDTAGDRAIYLAEQDLIFDMELYSVPIDGSGSSVKLSAPLAAGASIGATIVSADGSTVVYDVLDSSGDRIALQSAPVDGSVSAVLLSHALEAGEEILHNWYVSDDAPWLTYQVRLDPNDTKSEYYGVPIDGSQAPVQLAAIDAGTLNLATKTRLLYGDLAEGATPEAAWFDLYSVRLDGSGPADRLNTPVPGPLGVSGVVAPSAGHTDVLFQVGVLGDPQGVELFAVSTYGGLPDMKLNGPLVSGGGVAEGMKLNSTETHAIYRADQETDAKVELYATVMDSDGDGTPNATDNCRLAPNPSQAPVPFEQTALAADRQTFGWAESRNVEYVRGPLASVATYAVDQTAAVEDATTVTDPDDPASGAGFYYLFRLGGGCDAASWQTSIGAEPARDSTLP